MATFTFTECEIEASVLVGHREAFEELHAKIAGRSGEFCTISEPVSLHFEGQIGEGLRSTALENQESWSSALLACLHAYGMIGKVISDVNWYEERIETLRSEMATEIGGLPSTGSEEEDASLRDVVIERYNRLAEEAWKSLEERCEDTEDQIKEGPTPGNIRELIEAGHIGSRIAYATTGDTDYWNFDSESGEEIGEGLREALEGGNADSSEVGAYLALISALNSRSFDYLKTGEEFSESELEFLEGLHVELDKIETEEGLQGILAIPGILENSLYGEDDKAALLEAIGGTILSLSDEKLGGGFALLPEDIREAVQGPVLMGGQVAHDYAYTEYPQALASLAEILGNAPNEMEGGERFSTSLTLSMGQLMHEIYQDNLIGKPSAAVLDELGHKGLADLLEVSTRNEDANYTILMHEYLNGAYIDDDTAQRISAEALAGLLLYEWPEDSDYAGGSPVTALFDWIPEDASSKVEDEQRRAAEATVSLIEFMTDPEMQKKLMDTNVKVTIPGIEEGEEEVYPNAGFGQYNDKVAQSLTNIFERYIYSFAGQTGITDGVVDLGFERPNDWPTWDPESNTLSLSPEERLHFLELLMTDDGSAARIHGAAEIFSISHQASAVETGDFSDAAKRASTLQSFVDAALHNESVYRGMDAEGIHKRKENIYDLVSGTASGAIGEIPFVGFALSAAGDHYSEQFKENIITEFEAPSQHIGKGNVEEKISNTIAVFILEEAFENHNSGEAASPLVEVGDESKYFTGTKEMTVTEILESREILTYDNDGSPVISTDKAVESLQGLQGESAAQLNWAISRAMAGTEVSWVPGEARSGQDFLESFSSTYGVRSDMTEQLQQNEKEIKIRSQN